MTDIVRIQSRNCSRGFHDRCTFSHTACKCTCHILAPKRNEPRPPNTQRASFEDDLLYHAHAHQFQGSGFLRPDRDSVLLEVAHVIAKRGTCSRARVGAVIARDGRIIATGYNGAPSGMDHCSHEATSPDIVSDGSTGNNNSGITGCTISEHAERNAIAYAARYGVGTDGSDLYTTHAPCLDCSRSIINAGILRVFYNIPYRLTAGIELLNDAGVGVYHVEVTE